MEKSILAHQCNLVLSNPILVYSYRPSYSSLRICQDNGVFSYIIPVVAQTSVVAHFLALANGLVNLRATDVKLMRQLLLINESIESIKWMIEEKAIASRGSSLSGSLCSLLESQETSLHGSCSSLQDCSDGLDGISVGSYLDTLVDDVPGHQTPSDMDKFSDSSVTEDSQSLHKHPKIDSDEYYCFG
ncbi:hypothetical protein DV515_00005285 [Chloebia gouldiae]|uniref:Uncharacterized protein n=3 Tax=Passeriformes TaxID=9126 RepID=A0A3L8SPE2_CHLGU|nr:hypothetical protein DV515_00005285 [Chloebia gouldiae]